MRGVVLRSLADDDTGSQTRNDREREAQPVVYAQQV